MRPERRDLLAVSLAGTLLLIPWELFMAFGFTFTFRAREPSTTWLFLWFTFLLNIPAVLSSWIWPRVGAYWLLANVMVSLGIGAGFELISFLQATPPGAPSAASEFFNGILGLIYSAVFFWGPALVVAGGLLLMPLLTHLEGRPDNHQRQG